VLLVNRWFHPEVAGGAETSLLALAESLRSAGAQVKVFCQARRRPAGWDQHEDLAVFRRPAYRLPARAWSISGVADVLHEAHWLRRMREMRPDCIVARTFPSALASRIAFPRTRVIYWCPGSRAEWFGRFPPGSVKTLRDRMWAFWDRTQDKLLQGLAHRGADLIVAEAGHVARDLAGRLGVPERKLRVRRNGVDLERFRPRSADPTLLQELGLPVDRPAILTVGRLEAMKNQAFLMRAVAAMKQPASLIVVGRGGDAERLEKLAQELGIGDRTRLTGFRTDVERFYTTATVFVLPSIYEPYGNVFSEALACGIPTIGLRPAPGVSVPTDEHVDHGVNGFMVGSEDPADLAEKLDLLVSDTHVRLRLSANARRLAMERYRWEATAQGFLKDMQVVG
jgi:glycosyltransferase involved in cell wall biosynthesis